MLDISPLSKLSYFWAFREAKFKHGRKIFEALVIAEKRLTGLQDCIVLLEL